MTRYVGEQSAFSNVQPNTTATIDLPVDRRYHVLWIKYKTNANRATIETDILRIKVMLNGIVQWEISPKELFAIYERHGYTFIDGYLPLFFSEPWRRSPAGEDSTGWQLFGNIRTFQIDVEIAPGANAPALECFSQYDRKPGGLGLIRKYTRQQVPVAATGPHTLNNVPGSGSLHGFHCFETTQGDIANVRVKVNDFEVFNADRALAEALIQPAGGKPVAGMFPVAFDATERVADRIDQALAVGNQVTRSEFQLEFEMVVANPFFLVWEFIGPANA
ncbi:MAG: hypothetical protein COA52_09680 [Hyphomicrobiales bacterium]|nr:MAG: hypothetical protein COA52_09680 [Hyphomicrobiales bacterium]